VRAHDGEERDLLQVHQLRELDGVLVSQAEHDSGSETWGRGAPAETPIGSIYDGAPAGGIRGAGGGLSSIRVTVSTAR